MTPETVFYIFITIIIFGFIVDKTLAALNAKHYNDTLPKALDDIYEKEAYKKAQHYKLINYKFELVSSSIMFFITLAFLLFDGFAYIDNLVKNYSTHPVINTLLFFACIMLGSTLINLPFSYYKTFIIESRFGFNTTNIKTFIFDTLKHTVMGVILGGSLLAFITWFYYNTGAHFWLYAWAIVSLFTLIMNLFYAKLIVPLFNKQTPLKNGPLREAIANYASSVGFSLQHIYVIDGSKRSTKANAYFSGFGKEKRVTLYDTLITDLNTEEIVAVFAHEVGHYKRKHILYNLISTTVLTGLTFFILSIFISNPLLSQALGGQSTSFHMGLIAFGILYSPISELTGLANNLLSRAFEYQADDYAKTTYNEKHLISALKKLSKNSFSNLTPHPAYVFMHYSHPTLLQRISHLS